ncbi:MAG: thioredoxin-disulfide reductase [Lachnospiraceae bacterium]|nr:thioredoxin-disulfide reductase [Lachnospiraceae bacterium]
MSKTYDMLIIGSGPAGLGCALYAARAGIDALVIEKSPLPGGQIINTTEVDNYLGLPGIGGFEMGDTFRKHVEKLGGTFTEDEISSIEKEGDTWKLTGNADTYQGYTVVFATGAHRSKLGIPGEEEYTGRGVSYCATCDGAFFRNKETVVIGGGDVAVEDAVYLAGLCSHVTLVHRRDELRAAHSVQESLFAKENVTVAWNTIPDEVIGEGTVQSLKVHNKETGEETSISASGVFIAVGMKPDSELAAGVCELDERGYIKAGEDCKTSTPGIYAAGDVRTKVLRQVITAVADGACAVTSAEGYLAGIKLKGSSR